jgi:hypothetical protein
MSQGSGTNQRRSAGHKQASHEQQEEEIQQAAHLME